MMKSIETYIVDSFTDTPFKGNPAGVCILNEELRENDMQSIAIELGLSETAFVSRTSNPKHFKIRYFSPKMEIPLCGHATLASSKILFSINIQFSQIQFTTIEGIELLIQRRGDQIEMEFPIYTTSPQFAPRALLDALGLDTIVNCAFNTETSILLVEIDNCSVLRELKPDFNRLLSSHDAINGVLVTALSNQENYDFESRYFWPWSGTNEDPVTGGTHTFLAKYWSDKLNKLKLRSFQCSERSGFMNLEIKANNKLAIISQAQVILKGQLSI